MEGPPPPGGHDKAFLNETDCLEEQEVSGRQALKKQGGPDLRGLDLRRNT